MYENIELVAELYEHQDFGGKKIVLIANVDNLNDYGFNDKVSSVKVFRGPNFSGSKIVKLHRDVRFGGGAIDVAADQTIPDLKRHGFGDKASSVEMPTNP